MTSRLTWSIVPTPHGLVVRLMLCDVTLDVPAGDSAVLRVAIDRVRELAEERWVLPPDDVIAAGDALICQLGAR